MQKSKLGISVGLLGAALYFIGAISMLPALLLAGYVLLIEENEWLRKVAVKMVAIVVVFGILSIAFGLLQDAFYVVNIIANWFTPSVITMPLRLDSLLITALSVIENLLLVFMGFSALSMGTVKFKAVDDIINKHF